MKSLSAILRLSLPETFTILITLVVCLAGFTEAEVQTNYRKQDSKQQGENYHQKEASLKRNVPYAHQTSKMTENESKDKNIANFQNVQQLPLEKLIKRHSVDFGESDDSDEKDNDGYGYDDDEYYHFNFKRNDEALDNTKTEKEGVHDSNEREGVSGQKSPVLNQNTREKTKEVETIEMLNYKESHPNLDPDGNPTMDNSKPYSEELNRKKVPTSSNVLSSLKMSDLRGNSAIDEKMKERKDESGLSSGSAETKTADAKKPVKVVEDKDAVKLKDSKLTEDADQKEKETSLKDGKEAVVGKTVKETPKSSEEKEKSVKLSESAKLEENVDKITGKTKENDTPKLTREDTADMTRFADKMGSDVINPSGLNQINNRASFVSNDYKENADAMKTPGVEVDEKTSEEAGGMESDIGLSDYQDDVRSREKLRKLYSQRDVDGIENYESFNARDNTAQIFRDSSKPKDYAQLALELQNLNANELLKKDWKNAGLEAMKFLTQQPQRQQALQEQQQQQQQQQYLQMQQLFQDPQSQHQTDLNSDNRFKNNYGLSFPSNELENTEYHKNYIKSLKRYKSLNAEQKGILSDTSNSGTPHTNVYDEALNMKKKLQEPVKRRSMEMPTEQKESAQSKLPKLRRNARRDLLSCRSSETPHELSKPVKDDAKLAEGKKQEEQQEASRARRKSPIKLEYEIRVINQNPQDSKNAELSHIAPRRFEKDLKTKLATEEKYLKKYPYSQVSREDLTKLGESEGEKKFKRKAPIWKRHDKKSVIQTRAVPSGYYGNRVKFGQKNYARNNEQANSDPSLDTAHVTSSYLNGDAPRPSIDKSKLQRSWEVRQQDYKHDPMKRYDESGYMNKGNSLLLVRKGQRTATTFEEGSPHSGLDSSLSPDNLAKILSKDNDYIVLKKTDSNRFQKISETNPPTTVHVDAGGVNLVSKFSQEGDQQESLKSSSRQTLKNKGLYVRSFHSDKDDKKFSSASHSSKSNLKKTFDKFRDLAGFFKDNEQESTDNQYSAQELKEGRDIVFSEDKLPDPIVISNDAAGKNMAFNQKQQNSIYSISTNFKTLDQQDKKNEVPTNSESDKNMFTAEAKSDNSESSWEPALRNIFPEAKSINSMSKNGNEIIILDLNRNQLRTDHSYSNPTKMTGKSQQYGTFGITSQVPGGNGMASDNSIQLMLSPVQSKYLSASKVPQKSPFSNTARSNKAYAVVRTADNVSQVSVRNLADLPSLLKALTEKKSCAKLLAKRSSPHSSGGQLSENYKKFLTELNELSELNKSSYRKGKLAKKRTTEEIALPPSSFPELSNYGDANIKYLGNLLHNIMTGDNPEFKGISGAPVESSDGGIPKTLEESLKSNPMNMNSDRNSKYQRRWSSIEEKSKNKMSLGEDKTEDDLRSEMLVPEDKKFQDELLAELAAASEKISRLRREGAGTRKLRKTIEDSVALKGKHESGSSELRSDDKCSKLEHEAVSLSTKDRTEVGSELKSDHDMKESSDKSFVKSDYENHLSEFFENLNSHKNQKDQLNVPIENTWKRKKRKENHRRKRSASLDVKNKVSTTAVQNTILKNLAEDNYQSIYSPGIKRRLFSTNNEADDADNYSDAYERDKNVIVEEAQPKCVKNSLNECIDPMIVELFRAVDKEDEKNRARRSLTGGFHSNFKREIDLDESMPNDFQNFLVTSLGGFGSQNREVIKKDVALWERKESTQDANQIAESSPPGGKEDPNSTLEKREVPPSENRKGPNYFPSGASSDSNMADVMGPLNHAEKKFRSDNKSKLKSKAEFTDDKLPTQIRIQITNASAKEKKSSKPIMDESETTSTEMENLPKEKEFFDKNKINPLRLNNLPKLHNPSKNKFSFSDYEETDNSDSSSSQTPYRPHRRRRKKKKYVPENPTKPIKDFIKFDQKTMETFLKKIISDQNMAAADQTTHKSPVSNHLPQVETVYNPTQGTNKAQLEVSRFGKVNSANNKNTGTAKNNMQSTDNIGYDEGILRNYLKDKTDKLKSDKVKEYEEIDWKPKYGKMRLRQELGWEPPSMPTLKTPMTDSSFTVSTDTSPYMNPFSQHLYSQKNQVPSSSYFFHPSATNAENSNSLYDALKLKQEIKNQNALTSDHSTSKLFKKPFYYNNAGLFKSDDKERNQNSLFPSLNTGEGSWNYEYTKKPTSRGFKGRDFFTNSIKSQNHLDSKSKIAHGNSRKFIKNMDDYKSSVLDNPQSSPLLENTKDSDYLDNSCVEDDYLDEDAGKELQTEEPLLSVPMKYHRLYNSDVDDNMNEDEEEIDEDYEENSEEDDPDDYSLLANTKAMEPELTKNGHRKTKFQESFNDDGALSQVNYVYPKDNLLQLRGHSFEQTEFTNSKNDLKFGQGRQPIALADMKNDLGSLSSSTGLLKKANENANILGKNLMKNNYGYNSDSVLPNQLSENKMKELNTFYHHNKLFKRKMDSKGKLKRSREYPQIGSRLFYAAKTEINDNDFGPLMFLNQIQKKARNSKHAYCRRNPLNAEFTDPGNSLDNESKEYGNDNLLNLEEEEETDKDTDQDEDADFEDVTENLEDDGETISEDNVLENVIGKYIMRKRVASSDDLDKSEGSQTEGTHQLDKRSLGPQKYDKSREVKIVKRLSSGHLTENNFRKYHKKNFTRKREVNDFDFTTRGNAAAGKTALIKTRKRENTSLKKRSALDLFKKITNKDRDNKKVENVDGRTAGFEPLSSLNDKKYESSIRDAKFEFLNQVKKLSNESPHTQMKSNVIELKPCYPYEGQFTGDQRKREKVKFVVKENPGTIGSGPWKIELNDKYDVKFSEFPKNVDKLKEVVPEPASQENENLKAFLVFSNNLRAFKRSTVADFSPTSGSSQKEVGNSYRPKSGEGRRISKMHVSKRSLDSSLVITNDEDAAQTSRDHFTSGQITETSINIEEKNRALHDTMSLSEGDSKPQPPHVLQRNTKKIRSFVNDDEQCPNPRFPPVGSLNNRMSVFPPSNEANIMRDSRQVNEETSKYLGQQIVDAILSHVSANPKFRELIAPGLAARTTAYKEDNDAAKRPIHQADVSDQLQFFLQKFMLDIERLAEKHVRKRMCTQIDDQSKEFLQSLLSVSGSTHNNANEKCSVPEDYLELENVEEQSTPATTTDSSKTTPPLKPSLLENSTEELENLRKKHCLLRKLIKDYEKLTKLEKDSLRVHYQYLLEELEQTNKDLGSLNPITDSELCSRRFQKIQNDRIRNSAGFDDTTLEAHNATYQCPNCGSCPQSKTPGQKWQYGGQPPGPPKPNPVHGEPPVKIDSPKPKGYPLPTYSFEEDFRQNQEPVKVTPPQIFESVDSVNMTGSIPQKERFQNLTQEKLHPKEVEPSVHSSPTPQTFDLLPYPNSTQKMAAFDQSPGSSESIRFQQSLSGIDNFENFNNPIDFQNPKSLTELHKLSLGDAAGLQLSLKYRGPWVSNLDVAKTIRNVPLPLSESVKMDELPKPEMEEGLSAPKADRTEIDAPSVADVKDSRSLIAPSNEFSSYPNPLSKKNGLALAVLPYFNFGVFIPKNRPFESVNKNVGELRNDKIPMNYFLSKVSTSGKKRVFLRSNDLPPAPDNLPKAPDEFPRVPNDYPPYIKVPHSQKLFWQSSKGLPQWQKILWQPSNVLPQSQKILTKSSNVLPQTPYIVLQSPYVRKQYPDILMKSKNLQMQPSEVLTPGLMMQSPYVHALSSVTPMQPVKDMMEPSNSMMQPSEIVLQSPDVQIQYPEIETQSPDVQTQSPDVQTQSPDFLILAPDSTQSPDVLIQPSAAPMQSVNVLTQSQNIPALFPSTPTLSPNIPPQSPVQFQYAGVGSSKAEMEPSRVSSRPENHLSQPASDLPQSADEMSHSNIELHPIVCPSKSTDVTNPDVTTQPPSDYINFPRQRKPLNEYVKKHSSHHKKNRLLFSHFPLPSERKSKHKSKHKSKKSLNSKSSDEKDDDDDDDKNDEVEYLAWSTLPAVRRQLNKLEAGLELDDFFLKNPKLKKVSKGGEENPV